MRTPTIVVRRPGGPEELRLEQPELPAPLAGEVRVRQSAIGLNYIDVYFRTGRYPLPLPKMRYGAGTSPIIAGDLILLNRDEQEGAFLVALDRKTDEILEKRRWMMDKDRVT